MAWPEFWVAVLQALICIVVGVAPAIGLFAAVIWVAERK